VLDQPNKTKKVADTVTAVAAAVAGVAAAVTAVKKKPEA